MNKGVGSALIQAFPTVCGLDWGACRCEQHVPLVALTVSGRVAPTPAPVPPVRGGRASPSLVSVTIPATGS